VRFVVAIAKSDSTSANGAGEDKLIVPRSAAVQGDAEFTGKRKGGTDRPRKARRLIDRQKTAVVTGGANRMKKRWMIYLQRGCLLGL